MIKFANFSLNIWPIAANGLQFLPQFKKMPLFFLNTSGHVKYIDGKIFLRLLTGLLLMFFVMNTAQAAMVDVTRTAILVDDTDGNDPIKLKQAFAQILANNTGEDIFSILQNPVFIESNVKKGINRSYFEKVESQYLPAGSQSKFWFHLIMQESYIKSVIKMAQFSLLPRNRAPIMLWVVKEDDQQTMMNLNELPVTDELNMPMVLDYAFEDRVLQYWLQMWSKALAMEIVLPEADENDKLIVTPESIKTLSYQAIEHSKNRYQIDQVLMLYLNKSKQGVKLRSGLAMAENDVHIKHFQEPGASQAGVFYSLMADVADVYAQQYAIDSDKLRSSTVQMVFDDINGFDDVYAINQYLNQLSVINKLDTVSASVGRLVFNADIIINSNELLKMIERDGFLMPINNGSFNLLQFRIQR